MRRALTITGAVIAVLALAVAALIGYAVSERGLSLIVARIVAESGGRITVDEPTGSIVETMRFRRIAWRAEDASVTADDVVVDWNPRALWSKRLSIRGLGARHVEIVVKPSSGGPAQPPSDLRLPIAIDIARLDVGELDWRAGLRGGHLAGLEFGYSGDAEAHRIRSLRVVSDFGKLAGDLEVGARAPLRIAGNATVVGDAALAGVQGTVQLNGTVAEIAMAARGTAREAEFSLRGTATPFAPAPFANATADVTSLDIAALDATLPHTKARVHLDVEPRGAGLAGSISLVNNDAAPIDTERVPVSALSSHFTFDNDQLALTTLDVSIPENGRARGSGTIDLGQVRSATFALDIRDLDLARLHTKLVATRMTGRVSGDASAERQVLEGDVRDRNIGLAFRAVVDAERIDVERFRATTGSGALNGSAHMAFDAANAFSVQATMQRLDPSRFVAMPAASLDGSVQLRGALRPQWRADADITLASTSRVADLPTSGRFKGMLASGTVRDATLDITLASAKVHATGGVGTATDRIALTTDIPRIEELAALVPASVPKPIAGELHASGTVGTRGRIPGGEVDLRGRSLRAGPYAAATMHAHVSLAPLAPAARDTLDDRPLALDVTAEQLTLPERTIETLRATANGTLAQHRATLSLRAGDVDAQAAVQGTLTNVLDREAAAWKGTLVSLENRGAVPLKLRTPAALALHAGFARIANAHVDVAGGNLDVVELAFDHGHIDTRGAFAQLAVANVAKLAGRPLPVDSTLVMAGEWSIAATPRLNGTFALRRESGDVFVEIGQDGSAERRALGVAQLTIAGTFDNDALDATATFASERAGTANATLAIGAASGVSEGRIDAAAPLRLAARAEFASLALFQPFFGTSAVLGGRARVDVAADGTVGNPTWSGSLIGEALRIDAPQYGIGASDGRLRAHLIATGIAIDEIYLAAGDGTFTASGQISLPTDRGARRAPTHVTWKAERFRATNRPDMRLVVDGDGELAIADRRLSLTGNIAIVEGHVEYDPTPSGELASDIVIKGRTPPSQRQGGSRDLPVAIDVDVDLGRALTFTGEGIDTRLAGRVHVTTSPTGTLLGRGTIRAVNGTYVAFGQKLTIDRGRLIFDGPLDNPALDIVALRKNLAVEAGVELSGTVKVPQVRITSNPPVPENEALAWLVTGQGLSNTSRVDYGALSAASAALLGRNGKPFTAQLAQRLGIDDISLKSSTSGASGSDAATSQVVVFGKRISDRLSLGYEQGLSLASSAVRLEYALSRQVTLRAEAGPVSGIGIVYRRNFP